MSVVVLRTVEQFEEAASRARKIGQGLALFFTAEWHAPCKQVAQVLDELAKEHSSNVVLLSAEAELEELGALAEKYEVESVPTLFVFRDANPDAVEAVVKGADVERIVSEISRISKRAQVVGSSAALAAADSEQKTADNLNARLEKLVHAAPVMLFMKGEPSAPKCKFSRATIELLGKYKDLKYGYFDILTDDQVREGLKTYSNWKTYPQLYIKGKLVGGLDILKELDESGELAEMIPKPISSEDEAQDLNTRLKKLINSAPVILFMKGEPEAPRCGFSRTIIDLLNRNNVIFKSFDILTDNEVREGLKVFSNWKTYPQLYVNGQLIGGLDIVREMEENDEFLEVLPPGSIKVQ